MIIKKHKNKNEYLLSSTGRIWVRNMYKDNVRPVDINHLIDRKDYPLLVENEATAKRMRLPWTSSDPKIHENIVVVSDGLEFHKKHEILSSLPPKEVTVIATNGALTDWKLVGELAPQGKQRRIDYYVVNNPYAECMRFIPTKHRYYPQCIASTRTHKKFLVEYLGNKLLYPPVCDSHYTGTNKDAPQPIDDYRNPICAALGISMKFKVRKLLLLCCDDTLKEYRPASVPTHDGYWRYPQQEISEAIIDANLYWMSLNGVKIAYHSAGSKYNNASYIEVERIPEFFEQTNE